jgi:uncharacterized protein HemX
MLRNQIRSMEDSKNKAASEVVPPSTENTKPTISTTRRTVAAILILVAALLLGYVLYDVLL